MVVCILAAEVIYTMMRGAVNALKQYNNVVDGWPMRIQLEDR